MKNTRFWLSGALAAAVILSSCGQASESSVEANQTPSTTVEAKKSPGFTLFAKKITIPEGTPIKVRTTSSLSTASVESGAPFSASLAEPLIVDGKEVAGKGADVEGVVVDADKGGRVKGVASISVRLTKLQAENGRVTIKTGAYTKQARATKKSDAVKVGIGAGIGAAIGAIAGGGKGAAIGAASGGGAGTGVVLATRGEPAVIGAESLITFRLSSPVTVN